MFGNYLEFVFEYLPMAFSIRNEILSCGPYDNCIEMGCSIGGSTCHIAKISKETTGIDQDEERIAIARKRFKNIQFQLKDATATDYSDKQFDAAFLILFLHEAPNPAIIKEACRIAGEVVVIDYNYPLKGLWSPFFRFLERDKIRIFYEMKMEKTFGDCGYKAVSDKAFGGNFRTWVFRR